MGNYVIIALLAALIAWAAVRTACRSKKGGGCCGEREEAPEKVQVRDRNKAHYPYEIALRIGGMTCENCARKVENALNNLDGVWAQVPLDSRTARIRCKNPPDEAALRRAVREAGYIPMDD